MSTSGEWVPITMLGAWQAWLELPPDPLFAHPLVRNICTQFAGQRYGPIPLAITANRVRFYIRAKGLSDLLGFQNRI